MLGFGALGKFALGETAPTYGIGFSGSTVYWKYGSDAATTNATGYNIADADRLYAVTLIQGSTPGGVNTTITVPTDDLVFSSSAATVVRTANIAVTVPQGNLVEDGKVPTVFTTARTAVTPLQGNLAFSSVAVSISVLTVIAPLQGNLAFSPTVPTVVTTANIARTIPQGNLAFSPTVPAVNTRFNITVPQGNLVEDGKVPLVQILSNIIVPQGNFAFSPTVPTVFTSSLIARTPPQGNIAFSTAAPTVGNRNAFISFSQSLTGTFAHAEGKTLRQKLDPSLLNPLVGGIQVSFQFDTATNGSILAAYIGHAAATGDGFDFDGNQQQLLFSGSGTRSVTGATTVQSDANNTFVYDPTKPLIVSVAFGGTRVDLAMYDSGGGAPPPEAGALFHFDGADAATTTVDSSGNNHAMTLTTADLDNAQYKFGGTALHILSSGSLYELDGSADFAFGTGDFTIDFWTLLSSTSGTRVLYYSGAAYTTAGAYPGIRNVSGTGLLYTVGNTAVITGTGLVFNTWYHIAVTRSSGVTRMFVNGVQQGSDYTDSNNYIVAANRPACTAFNGWMDELHVVKGRAEWTANFTPRAVPWAGEGEVNAATDAWEAAVVANGGTVSSGRKAVVKTLVATLMDKGIWPKLDRLKLLAAENLISALVDLVSLDLATAVNSPTFTVDRGFAGNGSTSYIDTNFNPTTQAVKYAPGGNVYQGMMAVWDNTSRAVNGSCQTGTYIWPSMIDIFVRAAVFTSSDIYFHVNSSGYEGIQSYPSTTSQGFYVVQTSQFTANYCDNEVYLDGALLGTGAVTYGYYGMPNQTIYLLGRNDSGTLTAPTTDELSIWAIGGQLNATEQADFHTAIAAYRTALGM